MGTHTHGRRKKNATRKQNATRRNKIKYININLQCNHHTKKTMPRYLYILNGIKSAFIESSETTDRVSSQSRPANPPLFSVLQPEGCIPSSPPPSSSCCPSSSPGISSPTKMYVRGYLASSSASNSLEISRIDVL